MFLLRLLGLLVALAIGAGIAAWLFTGDKRYLRLAARLGKAALAFVLLVLVLMAAERLIIL